MDTAEEGQGMDETNPGALGYLILLLLQGINEMNPGALGYLSLLLLQDINGTNPGALGYLILASISTWLVNSEPNRLCKYVKVLTVLKRECGWGGGVSE